MSNRPSMAKINGMVTLHASGHSNPEIGRLLAVHRETVGKYLAVQNQPNAPTVSLRLAQHLFWRGIPGPGTPKPAERAHAWPILRPVTLGVREIRRFTEQDGRRWLTDRAESVHKTK
jgi:hypothetical protein